jgi:tetratricopeptide (TPR) repeat protein
VAALATAALQHLQAGRLAEAEQALRRILGPHPDDPDATHLLGLVALQRRDLASAAELLRRATRLDPAQPAAWNNYGAVLREQGELGEAVAAYRKALAVAPDFTDALCNLGGALNRLGREAEALPALRRAIALEPNHAEALNNLASAATANPGADPGADPGWLRGRFIRASWLAGVRAIARDGNPSDTRRLRSRSSYPRALAKARVSLDRAGEARHWLGAPFHRPRRLGIGRFLHYKIADEQFVPTLRPVPLQLPRNRSQVAEGLGGAPDLPRPHG